MGWERNSHRYHRQMADERIRDDRTIEEQIDAKRADKEFMARLHDVIDRNREALDLLAKGDEEQADL